MKLLNEKLIKETAIKLSHWEVPSIKDGYSDGLMTGIEFGFEKGVEFAEEQFQQKMIEFINYSSNFIHYFLNGQNLWLSKEDYETVKTTDQLLKEFLNKE